MATSVFQVSELRYRAADSSRTLSITDEDIERFLDRVRYLLHKK